MTIRSKNEPKTSGVPIWLAEQPIPDFSPTNPLRAIQRRGSVRVGVLDDLPGFAWKDPESGERTGLDIEIARFMAQGIFGGTLDLATDHIDFVDITAAQRQHTCRDATVDFVVATFAVTESRRSDVDFTDPYDGTHLAMISRAEDAEPEVSKARVAVVEGSTSSELVRQQSIGAHVLTFENTSEVPIAVASGEADIGIIMSAPVQSLIETENLPLRRTKSSLAFDPWAIGVRKGNEVLRAFLDNRLQTMVRHPWAPMRHDYV